MEFYEETLRLLNVDFVIQGLIAATLLGIVSGVMAPFVVIRRMSFAVHGTSELALMGASAALLAGLNIGIGAVIGSIVAAIILALLGMKNQDSAIGVVFSFGMGLSVLFIHLYPGRASTAFTLLTGQIVGVSGANVKLLAIIVVIVIGTIALLWRPLLYAAADPILASASGINIKLMSVIFAVLVGLTSAQSVQIVGALLVMALLITPGAAAVSVTANPMLAVVLSTLFSLSAAVGGFVLSLAPGLPVSVFVTSISFVIYLICRGIGALKEQRITTNKRQQAK